MMDQEQVSRHEDQSMAADNLNGTPYDPTAPYDEANDDSTKAEGGGDRKRDRTDSRERLLETLKIDERKIKKEYWPSNRCKIPFDVREMSYEQYVEKHYSIMREKFWLNYTGTSNNRNNGPPSMQNNQHHLPQGNHMMPPMMPPHAPMMPVGGPPFYNQMMPPPMPMMHGPPDPSFFYGNPPPSSYGPPSHGHGGRGGGGGRGGYGIGGRGRY
jgi:hypothetical protein